MASHVYKLGVHKLKDIETWANYMENTPKYTRWTPKLTLKTIGWGLVVPFCLFKAMQPFYNYADIQTNRNVIDYEQGFEVFTEYGKAGGKQSHSKYTSL